MQDPSKSHRCVPLLVVLILRVDPTPIPAPFFKDVTSRILITALAETESDWKQHQCSWRGSGVHQSWSTWRNGCCAARKVGTGCLPHERGDLRILLGGKHEDQPSAAWIPSVRPQRGEINRDVNESACVRDRDRKRQERDRA